MHMITWRIFLFMLFTLLCFSTSAEYLESSHLPNNQLRIITSHLYNRSPHDAPLSHSLIIYSLKHQSQKNDKNSRDFKKKHPIFHPKQSSKNILIHALTISQAIQTKGLLQKSNQTNDCPLFSSMFTSHVSHLMQNST